MALHGLGQLDQELETYEQGAKIDPTNAQIKQGINNIMREMT